jgi:hypothetical protein
VGHVSRAAAAHRPPSPSRCRFRQRRRHDRPGIRRLLPGGTASSSTPR